MKQDILRTLLIGLLLLSTRNVYAIGANAAAVAKETDNSNIIKARKAIQDSASQITYENGVLRLGEDDAGVLYEYPNDGEGDFKYYKAIYYLFTSRQYVHLSDDSQAADNVFMMFRNKKGKWVDVSSNSSNKDYAADKVFRINNMESFVYAAKVDSKAEILLSVNSSGEYDKEKTILLVVLPTLEKSRFKWFIKQGNNNKMTFEEFTKKIALKSDSKYPLAGYFLVVERSNSIVVSSITYGDSNILKKYRDTPLKDSVIAISLDSISFEKNPKELKFYIAYNEVDKKGKITAKRNTETLKLTWDNDPGGWGVFVVVIVCAALVGVILFIRRCGLIRTIGGKEASSDNKSSRKKKKKDKGRKEKNGSGTGIKEGGKSQKEVCQNSDEGNGNKQENVISKAVMGINDQESNIASLKKENERLFKQIEGLRNQIKTLEGDKEKEKIRADEAEEKAKKAAEKEIEKEIKKTKEAEQRAIDAEEKAKVAKEKADKAEINANKNADVKIKKIEQEASLEVKKAQELANAAKAEAEKDIMKAKAEVTRERGEELAKLIGLAKRLQLLLNEIPDDAFGKNGLVLKSGVDSYYNNLDSVVNLNLSLKRSLEEMREYSLAQLGIGSSCWIHCLGRLYSYLSVEALRNQLEYEGVNAGTLTEAFRTLVVLLAVQGIVIQNCSIGFDSITDLATNNLFELDMMIDRITNWLGGSDRVRKTIPNHGNTIYDFGTLAYYSVESTDVHRGKVMYYDE